MKNKISILILLFAITIPQVASASWWNPFSWKVFSRFFEPKVEKVEKVEQVATSTENTASTTNQVTEIEQLRAELEELKKNQTNQKSTTQTTKISPKQNTSSATPISSPQTPVKTISRDEMFADVMQKYTNFMSSVANERDGLSKTSPLTSEIEYLSYLNNLLKTINADLGYLVNIKNWNPRPVIEEIYLSKFNKLKREYDVEVKRYITAREKDLVDREIARQKAAEEDARYTALEKQNIIQSIKIKIAEMDQLRTQIETLSASSLVNILNEAKKLDGDNLFYTFKFVCGAGGYQCSFYYPYEVKYLSNNHYVSDIEAGLEAIVANYRAFLVVELAKNQ